MKVDMSATERVFLGIHLVSMAGGLYFGWHHGGYVKQTINTPLARPWKDRVISFRNSEFITEDVFCGIVGSLAGMLVGRVLWPIALPYSAWYIERSHGEAIRRTLKNMQEPK